MALHMAVPRPSGPVSATRRLESWLILAGRGFGKSRAGAEWVRHVAETDPSARIALVAATLGEAQLYGRGRERHSCLLPGAATAILRAVAEAGDFKVGGTMRLHEGWRDRAADPLIAAAEVPIDAPTDASWPMSCGLRRGRRTADERPPAGSAGPIVLGEPALSVTDGDFGGRSGFRAGAIRLRPRSCAITTWRLQPGLQRAAARAGPASRAPSSYPPLAAADAHVLSEIAARRALWRRETVAWRCALPDPALAQPLGDGRWRLTQLLRGRGGTESALVGHADGTVSS